MTKAALVTGASGAIGKSISKELKKAGYVVIGTDKVPLNCEDKDKGTFDHWIEADLGELVESENKISNFINTCNSWLKKLELQAVIHNAAIQHIGKFEDISTSQWLESYKVNVIAPALISKELMIHLKKNNGSIVHVGSIHSHLTKPGFCAYASSKAALAGLTKAMSIELGNSVRVNAVEPAAINTPMLEESFRAKPHQMKELASMHPVGFIGSPNDFARAAMFLIDPVNKFINGCIMEVSGGINNRLYDPL